MDKLTLTVIFEPAEEGGFNCYLAEFPDIFSQGETLEQATEMIADALKTMSEYRREQALVQAKANGSGILTSHYTRHCWGLIPPGWKPIGVS